VDESTLVTARLLQGVAPPSASPTAVGADPPRRSPRARPATPATAVFAADDGIGSVIGLVVGGALTEVSWVGRSW